jgi:hypothetical protein
MNNTLDEKLGQLLRQDAPPERDPAFRIGLLERRERQRYERRQRWVLASAVMVVVFIGVIVGLSQALGVRMWMTSLVAFFCAAAVAACLGSVRGVMLAVRHMGRG